MEPETVLPFHGHSCWTDQRQESCVWGLDPVLSHYSEMPSYAPRPSVLRLPIPGNPCLPAASPVQLPFAVCFLNLSALASGTLLSDGQKWQGLKGLSDGNWHDGPWWLSVMVSVCSRDASSVRGKHYTSLCTRV